tara:strand:- start:215 stop:559 length:345 start_codon:yes stop_codon:yes gene_type:complete
MRYLLICIPFLFFVISNKTGAEEKISTHTMSHIVGGLGSFFLGPLPGLGLAIIPEAISILNSDDHGSLDTSKKVFYVNKYSNEYEIIPYHAESSDEMITKYENTVKLTNSLKYY